MEARWGGLDREGIASYPFGRVDAMARPIVDESALPDRSIADRVWGASLLRIQHDGHE